MIIEFTLAHGSVAVLTRDVARIKTRINRDADGLEDGTFNGSYIIMSDNSQFETTMNYDEAKEVWAIGLQALARLSAQSQDDDASYSDM